MRGRHSLFAADQIVEVDCARLIPARQAQAGDGARVHVQARGLPDAVHHYIQLEPVAPASLD